MNLKKYLEGVQRGKQKKKETSVGLNAVSETGMMKSQPYQMRKGLGMQKRTES